MRRALGLLLVVAVLSGCAAKSGSPAAAPATASSAPAATRSASAPSSTDPSVVVPPTKVPKTRLSEPPTDEFTPLTADGKVRLSGGCVELVTSTVLWTLIGPQAAGLRDGQQVKVTGLPDPNHETPCSGAPLLVSAVTPH